MNGTDLGEILGQIRFIGNGYNLKCSNSKISFKYSLSKQHAVIIRERIFEDEKNVFGIMDIGYSPGQKNEYKSQIKARCYDELVNYIEKNVLFESGNIIDCPNNGSIPREEA
ncbi:MAG: hypothetical protein Q7S33_01930 [Nanoarchaeota archaeon]|nr:hypothetical protein [Nanoarchaeota archaeon]